MLAVGRNHGMLVRSTAVGQRVNGVVRQIHPINFAIERLIVRIGPSIRRDQHALAVDGECGGAVVFEIAPSQLADRTAVGADDKELTEHVLQIAFTVDPKHHRSMSFGGSAHFAFFGASGKSAFRGLRSAATGMVKASHRPSGDHAGLAGGSVKLLMAVLTPLSTQYTNSCVEPSPDAPKYARRVPSGDQRGAELIGALESGRGCFPSAPTSQMALCGLSILMS